MSVYALGDRTFLQHGSRWFLREPAWETFRPITEVTWDGGAFQVNDHIYTQDPLDELYGFGCAEEKALCDRLEAQYGRVKPVPVTTLPTGGEWFRDRRILLTPCAPRDVASWKRMCRERARTCRHAPRGKTFTRRTLA